MKENTTIKRKEELYDYYGNTMQAFPQFLKESGFLSSLEKPIVEHMQTTFTGNYTEIIDALISGELIKFKQ